MEKIYKYDERLIRFAGESVFFSKKMGNEFELIYYKKQLIRSSGSAALNYGEAQGTVTSKDFVHKTSVSVKELKESRATLKIIRYINEGDSVKREWLINEAEELIAIGSKMINNKK